MAEYVSTLTGPEMDAALIEMNAHNSEAYAIGTRGGDPVPLTDPTYHNNAKYYAEQAEQSADDAEEALDAITDLTVSAEALDEGESPTVTKTLEDDHYNFEFGIPKGDTGEGASVTAIAYGVSSSYNTQPSTWQSTIPILTGGNYLWTRITWNDGTSSYSVARQGIDGNGAGDMQKADYDSNSAVLNAGGIAAYVQAQIASAISSALSDFLDSNNILLSTDEQEEEE